MKEKAKFGKKLLLLLALSLLIGIAAPCAKVQAASQKSKAIAAYKKLLTQKTVTFDGNRKITMKNCKFALAYVDNNSVPELLLDTTSKGNGYRYKVYTYSGGKAKIAYESVNPIRYYPKKGIVAEVMSGEYSITIYAKMNVDKSKRVHLLSKESFKVDGKVLGTDYREGSYLTQFKNITKAAFNSQLKKLVGTAKLTAPSYKTNTAANRSKYLK